MFRQFSFGINSIFGIIAMAILAYFAFYLFKFIYVGLWFIAPIILIALFFINKEVLFQWFGNKFQAIKMNPLPGILNFVVAMLLLPFSLVGMLGKTLFIRKINQIQNGDQQEGFFRNEPDNQFVEFEDLSEEVLQKEEKPTFWQIEDSNSNYKSSNKF